MQFPSARIYIPLQRRVVTVHPGGFIGRLTTAAIQIPDPRISEAHALVSLRGNRLRLLRLRGSLRVAGEEVEAVVLEQGTSVDLADGIRLFVEDTYVPATALVLCGAERGPEELVATTYSLIPGAGPNLRLVSGYIDGARAYLWVSAASLWLSRLGAEPEPISIGRAYELDGSTVQVISIPVSGTSDTLTTTTDGGERAVLGPLVLVARYTSVHLHRGGSTLVISGRPANLVSELVRFGLKPIPWEVAAKEIWGVVDDRMALRQNLDRTLQRLRERLREFGVRDNLVAPDGTGNIELVLEPGDRVIDET